MRGVDSSGLLVGVSGSGGLVYVPVPDLADLRGTASMLRERMAAAAALQRQETHVSFSPEVGHVLQALGREPRLASRQQTLEKTHDRTR
jgi:hypothetical protein